MLYTIGNYGLTAIAGLGACANGLILHGQAALFPAIPAGTSQPIGPIVSSMVGPLANSSTGFIVRQQHALNAAATAAVVQAWTFNGEDASATISIHNQGKLPILAWGLGEQAWGVNDGIACTFSQPPTGFFSNWDPNQLAMCPEGPITRGCWLTDGKIGIGLGLSGFGLNHAGWFWGGPGAWFQQPGGGNARTGILISDMPILPGQTVTFQIAIRVSTNTTWQHLFQAHKNLWEFDGTILSTAQQPKNNAPISLFYECDLSHVTAANPFGFNGLDLSTNDGVQQWVSDVVIPGAANGFLGTLFMNLMGEPPGQESLSPDFSTFPAPIQANIPALAAAYKASGQVLGFASRPSYYPNEPFVTTLGKFSTLTSQGALMFYLDSFGTQFRDVEFLKFAMSALKAMPLYVEHPNELTIRYAGGLCEVSGSAGNYGLGYNVALLQFLRPGVPIACLNGSADLAGQAFQDWCAKQNMSAIFNRPDVPNVKVGA